jgi:hypothetical protein
MLCISFSNKKNCTTKLKNDDDQSKMCKKKLGYNKYHLKCDIKSSSIGINIITTYHN